MAKITTDFVGTETEAVTKARITEILDFWGFDPSAYTTWGNARTDANAVLSAAGLSAIGATERAGPFLPKLNAINNPDVVISGFTGLAAWYDPSDLSTLWQDTAATTPVTADGQSVARIDDKSGNGNHLTNATPNERPLYKTSGGLHWLEFDGSNFIGASTNILPGNTIFSTVVGMRGNPTSSFQSIMGNANGITPGNGWHFYLNSNSLTILFRTNGAAQSINSAGESNRVLTGLFNPSTQQIYRLNGGSQVTNTPTAGGAAVNNFNMGNGAGLTTFFAGRIYGAVMTSTYLSANEIAFAESYMAQKSEVTL